jgi:hypothetical protein
MSAHFIEKRIHFNWHAFKEETSYLGNLVVDERIENVRWAQLHQDKVQWWPLVNTVMNLLTPGSRVLLEKLSSQLVKKFPAFYGTRRFITVFTRAHHLSLSRAR